MLIEAVTDGKSAYATIVASGRLSLAHKSEVVPDCTATVVPAIFRSRASVIAAEPVAPITPWLLV